MKIVAIDTKTRIGREAQSLDDLEPIASNEEVWEQDDKGKWWRMWLKYRRDENGNIPFDSSFYLRP